VLADRGITADKLAVGSIGGAPGTPGLGVLADRGITADKLAVGSIGGAPGTPGLGVLANAGITADKLSLGNKTINGAVLTDKSVAREALADNSVDQNKLAAGSVGIAALILTGNSTTTPISKLGPGKTADVSINVDSLLPQLLLVSVLPTSLDGIASYTQKAARISGGENKVKYTVTVTNTATSGDLDCNVILQTFATATA
jgi:hypothetical protein